MRRSKLFIIILLMMVLVAGCSNNEKSNSGKVNNVDPPAQQVGEKISEFSRFFRISR